ncbi:MAG: hypothetical protein RLZZ67_647 [Candidatus Parcubacteria bacterium]|jgi:hypothetical protein
MNQRFFWIWVICVIGTPLLWFNFFKGDIVKVQRPNSTTYINASKDVISVSLPFPGAVTGKNFSVIGQARGLWFFEATFPLELVDTKGNLVARTVAHAESDWMTENLVPFTADFKVPETFIGQATLVLKKDNPSGLAEYDASMSFPINVEY